MKKIIWMITTLFILSFTQIAFAQMGQSSGPSFYGEFKPVVGGWSEYQITSKREGATKMKVAVVGMEGDAYWYETVMEGGKRGTRYYEGACFWKPERSERHKEDDRQGRE